MKLSMLLSFVLVTVTPILGMSESSNAQVQIRDLQQRAPGIQISGKVISVVGNDFILDDDSGQIIVDAGPRWWQPLNLTVGEQITVTGEIERSGEFDAFSITRSNGTVINIRPAAGPPPWAGGPNRNRPR
jgi:hypothetical protein